MGGPIAVPSPFPPVVPNPINPNTPGFQIAAVQIVSSTQVIVFAPNNLRVGDRIVIGGLRTFTGLNNQILTITATAPTGTAMAAFAPTANSITINNPGTIPAGLTGIVNEIGIITRLGAGPTQPALFFTDPAPYDPPQDGSGPLIVTNAVMSRQHPGRMISDMIIGSMTRVARMSLNGAELATLTTVPIQVVPEPVFVPSGLQGTPGRGLAYVVKDLHAKLVFGTTAYTGGTVILYQGNPLGTPAGQALTATFGTLLASTADTTQLNIPLLALGALPSGQLENQALWIGGTNATGGDGFLDVIIEYTVVQT